MIRACFVVVCCLVAGCTCVPSSTLTDGGPVGGGGGSTNGGGATGGGSGLDVGTAVELMGLGAIGADYSLGNTARPAGDVALSESRLYVFDRDGGSTWYPQSLTGSVNSVSRDGQYGYSSNSAMGVIRLSDGVQTVTPTERGAVFGELSDGLVYLHKTSTGWDVYKTPFDGTAGAVMVSLRTAGAANVALLPNDLVVVGDDDGLRWFDAKRMTAPQSASTLPVVGLWAVPHRAMVNLLAGPENGVYEYAFDLSRPEAPVLTSTRTAYPFFARGQLASSLVRVGPTGKTLVVTPAPGVADITLYTSSRTVNVRNVFAEAGLVWWEEYLDAHTQHAYVAELTEPFAPIDLPQGVSGTLYWSEGARQGFLYDTSTQHDSITEIDLVARTVTAPRPMLKTPVAVLATSYVYQDETTHHLKVKRIGQPEVELTNQHCMLLGAGSKLGLHQCADGQLYRFDDDGRQVAVAGIETGGSLGSLSSSGDLLRLYGVEHVWLEDLRTRSVLLSEFSKYYQEFALVAGHYVRRKSLNQEPTLVAITRVGSESTQQLRMASWSYVDVSTHRDGGAHLPYVAPLTDGGAEIHLYDLATDVDLATGLTGRRINLTLQTDRLCAGVTDELGASNGLLTSSGQLLGNATISDGGTELVLRDTLNANGDVHYFGQHGIYDSNLKPLVEIEGSKTAFVDSSTGVTYYLTAQGSGQTVLAMSPEGTVTMRPSVEGVVTRASLGDTVWLTSAQNGVTTVRSYRPATGELEVRWSGTLRGLWPFAGGVVVKADTDAGTAYSAVNLDGGMNTLVEPGERVLGLSVDQSRQRMLLRSTVGGWQAVQLSVIDLPSARRSVLAQSDATRKVGAFAFVQGATAVVYTVSGWGADSVKTMYVPLAP